MFLYSETTLFTCFAVCIFLSTPSSCTILFLSLDYILHSIQYLFLFFILLNDIFNHMALLLLTFLFISFLLKHNFLSFVLLSYFFNFFINDIIVFFIDMHLFQKITILFLSFVNILCYLFVIRFD